MSLLPPSTDYTDLDAEALRRRIYELLATVFPAWDDDSRAEFGNILVEIFAFVGDVLAYYLDSHGDESRWGSAKLRSSLLSLVKLVGYRPRGATASQVTATVSIASGTPTGRVVIPAETVVRTRDAATPTRFRVLEATEIDVPGGDDSVDVLAEHSESVTDVVESDSGADQEFVLSRRPYLDGSLVAVDDVGVYEEVDDFLSSGADDRHFTTTVDDSNTATVRFGNGANGRIPSGAVVLAYRVGGGSSGQVDAGSVTAIDGTFADEFGAPVTLAVTNAAASTAALDRETRDEIKVAAPRWTRRRTRTVTREDFEIGALEVPGVARAIMVTSNQDPGVAENTGVLYVVPTAGGEADQSVLDAVYDKVTVQYPTTITFDIQVSQAPYLPVDVFVVVHLAADADPVAVREAVRLRLVDYFDPVFSLEKARAGRPQVDFGERFAASALTGDPALPWSDVHDEIVDVDGVRKIDTRSDGLTLNGARADVELSTAQFPVFGDLVVIDAATNLPIE